MDLEKVKILFKNFASNYDQKKSQIIWDKQSRQFKDFWNGRVMEDKDELTTEEMDHIIRILDSRGKGIRGSGVEPVCMPMGITQKRWYRLFKEIKKDKLLKKTLDKLFNSSSKEEQIKLINEIYEGYHNSLTTKSAVILNDILFANNPEDNISVASLAHRSMIIDAFELGRSEDLVKLSYGDQVIRSKDMVVSLKSKLGLSIDNRGLSIAFYRDDSINEIWFTKKEKKEKQSRKIKVDKPTVETDAQLEFEIQEEDEPVEIDLKDKRVYSEKSDRTIFELSHQNKRGRLKLNPEFQRHYVWDDNTASRLIESVFLEVPIPIIYFAEENNGDYSVIDGQQRLKSLFNFLDNELELKGLQVYRELNGKKYQDLGPDLQNKFENYTIRVIEIRKESHPVVKFEIFERLNRGSFKLNDQELRNCIYRGKYNNLLKELAEDKDFMFLLGLKEPHKRMFDRELILRFFSFYHSTYLNYSSPMKRFFNMDMEKNQNINPNQEDELRKVFKKAVTMTKSVFGNNAFKRFMPGTERDPNGIWEKVRINQALFDVIMFSFTQYDQNQVVPLADPIREELIWLMTHDQEFIDSILISTSSKDKVYTRFEKWIHFLKEVLGAPRREERCFTLSLKEQLFNANPTCAIDSQRIHTVDDAEIDHVDFYWRGGKTIPSNARLVHRYCNRARGGRD